jgi:hypothetical protein
MCNKKLKEVSVMAKAKKAKQLSFALSNRVGLLSQVSSALADAKINMKAICAYGMEKQAYFMVVTDKNAKAKKALGTLKKNIAEEEVVAVEMPNRAGALQKIAQKISDAGIDIIYMYGTAGTGRASICVFKTVDDTRAVKAINK